ncbi:lipin Ned1, partial [Basidiobolus ranarum]
MQYVGKVLTTVTEFYKEINSATLSGAIDIVVIEQPDGELACSPFHVRFGKLQLLRPQDKKVEVAVNGKVVNFPMKVGDAGEAFFVFETEELVPDEYSTSPLVEAVEGEEEPEFLDIGPSTEPVGEENDTGYVSAHSGHGTEFGEDEKSSDTVTH